MTALRQRYIADLRLRNKSPRTIETYVLRVSLFARHFERSPELLGPEHVRAYQEHLIAQPVSWSTFNQAVCALRFLYNVTLGRPELIAHLPFAKRPRTLPTVLSPEEVMRFLEASLPGRDRALLQTAYGCGLRLKELLGLQVRDIDSARLVLHIRHGKGQKERLVPLSPRLLQELRDYWREYRPATWLFPGAKATRALTNTRGAADLPADGAAGRVEQARASALAASQLCHPLAGSGGRSALGSGSAGSQSLQHDGQVSAREPATSATVARVARRAGRPASRPGAAAGGGPAMTATAFVRPAWEVADVIREHGDAFRAKYGGLLSLEQKQALRQLAACRTAALGGHVQRCLDCGHERIAYNSCRNRHCPKCQALARARWLERQSQHLLPVEYFHVVFTLPAALGALVQANARLLYEALLQTAAQTLRDVAANPKRLGAKVGMLLVLHTWGQNLHHHPHVHAVVTGGGLSCNAKGAVEDEPRWVCVPAGFLLAGADS